mgnify:CR=1 FL=1
MKILALVLQWKRLLKTSNLFHIHKIEYLLKLSNLEYTPWFVYQVITKHYHESSSQQKL